MSESSVRRSRKELSSLVSTVETYDDLLAHSVTFLAESLECSILGALDIHGRSYRFRYDPQSKEGTFSVTSDIQLEAGSLVTKDGTLLSLPCFWDTTKQVTVNNYLKMLAREGVNIFAAVPIFIDDAVIGWLESTSRTEGREWLPAEQVLLKEATNLIGSFTQKISGVSGMKRKQTLGVSEELTKENRGVALLDEAPWVIFDILKDGTVEYVSAKVSVIMGISSEAVRSETIFESLEKILIDVYKAEAFRKLQKVIDAEETKAEFFAEIRNPTTGDTRQFQFQAEAGRPGSGRIVLVLTDVSRNRMYRDKLDEAKLRSMRLVEYGNLIIIRTDLQLRIADVLGDTSRILGIPPERLLHDKDIWNQFLEFEDFRSLARTIQNMGKSPHELSQEVRVINQKTKAVHWLLLTAVPLYSSQGDFIGWEGFGLDVTEKRQTELELIQQSRRIQALYEVSSQIDVDMDPAFVALRGLRSMMGATGSDSGFCALYDRRLQSLELVATHGCSQEYVDSLSRIMGKKNLVRRVVEDKRGFFTNNMQKLSSARYGLAEKEGIRSAIFMPLICEDPNEGTTVIGCLQLACKKARQFTQEDFDLVQAAAAQIALVIRQAEYYESEKREANSLAILYRLTHTLAKTHSPEEVVEKTFSAVQEQTNR
jgi:PAS domain S-box-containing protein